MPSFDVVSKVDLQEIDNAVNSVKREIANRYDFKGAKASVELKEDGEITIIADDDYKLESMQEMLRMHTSKRSLDVRCLDFGKEEKAFGNSIRQVVKVKQGIESDIAKDVVKNLKAQKFKAQASIRGDELRVESKSRDELQAVMAHLKSMDVKLPLQFINFRD